MHRPNFVNCGRKLSGMKVSEKQWAQGEPVGAEGQSEDDGKMEVGEEVDSKEKLEQRKKELLKQLRNINEGLDMPQATQETLREKWQQELQDIEQRRNDLLPEHQQMQMRSPKLQSLHYQKKKQCQKDLGNWAGDSERIRNEIEESHAQIEELGQQIQKVSMADVELDEEIRNLQAGDGQRGRCASQSNGCCFDPLANAMFCDQTFDK